MISVCHIFTRFNSDIVSVSSSRIFEIYPYENGCFPFFYLEGDIGFGLIVALYPW